MGLPEMLRVAWAYYKLMVCIMVIYILALLAYSMLNQVPGFRASHNHPRFEVGSISQVRNSTEIPTTQPDLATVLSDPQVHARSRVGLEQIESLQPVIEEQSCSICLNPASPSAHVRTLACGHKFHTECIGEWVGEWVKNKKPKPKCPFCPNCRADIDRSI